MKRLVGTYEWLPRPSLRSVGLLLGPLLFLVTLLLPCPEGLDPRAFRVLAVTAWTATWWVTEALPINATALLPFVLFPFLGIMGAPAAAKASMNDSLFLFLGGFFLAAALERWGLHRRLAVGTLKVLGTSPRRLILGVMIVVAFLSLWITNTATTVMMLPILLAVIHQAEESNPNAAASVKEFGAALLLGCALAANIGGMGTPVGTVPNAVLIGQLRTQGIEISFLDWMKKTIPVVVVLVPLAWLILVRVSARFPKDLSIGNAESIREQSRSLGKLSRAERRVGAVFLAAVFLWIFRQDLSFSSTFTIPGWASLLETSGIIPAGAASGLRDGTVAVIASLLLFAIPSGEQNPDGSQQDRLLTWEVAAKVPWGVLFLLGGGFCLASGFTISEEGTMSLGQWLGVQLKAFTSLPPLVQILGIALSISLITEFASNTATCTLMIPILFGIALTTGADPLPYGMAAALAASCSFMMPVATPPNAMVFGTGRIPMGLMVRNGIILNVVGAVVVGAWIYISA